MTSTSQQLNELKRRLRSLEARQRGREANTLIFTAVGEAVMCGCKVTEGSDSTDMVVALEGQAAGDADNHNPDFVDPPVRAFEYPNIASLKGGAYLSQDDEAEAEPPPATGTARYDIAYIFAGQSGPGFAIAQGAPSSNVKTDFDANGLDTSDFPSQFDPDLPVGAFPVGRIYVEDVYTGIQNARIADIRFIAITRQVIQGFDQTLNTDDDVQFNSVDAASMSRGGSTLYGRDNVIGTVSQSGGEPTGAVIERGSNANGEYVIFADGTAHCWHRLPVDTTETSDAQEFPYPLTPAGAGEVSPNVTFWYGTSITYRNFIQDPNNYFIAGNAGAWFVRLLSEPTAWTNPIGTVVMRVY